MEKFEQILTESDRRQIIAKNRRGILAALKEVDRATLKIYDQLITDAASYACAIYECNLLYMRDGISEYYQNGENQWGVKKSVAAELRVKYTATYQKLIIQLTGLLPSEDEKAAAAELMDFINQE
ncbi:MAG TPA: hypothetical protein DCF66_03710 [Lachnospiraceae bacterium]|nr:hypothetical protein [Lachnospiraceae bacterium]